MENLLDLRMAEVPRFLLALCRVSGVLMLAPVFGSRIPPAPLKALMALLLAFLFWPLIPAPAAPLGADGISLGLAAFQELGLGLLIGFFAASIFAGVQFGGYLIDQELGILQANILDPLSQEQISIVGQFKVFLATTVYLLIDGHHLLIDAMARSFRAVPLTGLVLTESAASALTGDLLQNLFRLGIEIAAPALVTLFLVTIALAFMARTAPEMNLFVLGFSIRVMIGLLVLAAGTGLFVAVFRSRHLAHDGALRRVVEMLGG
jgi:flagellar biosynthetic protein FliR